MAKIRVSVVTPERVVWSGEATAIYARGRQGELGILPGHAPLLADLGIGVLRVEDEGRMTQAAVHGGFLHVLTENGETRADVLAESAELSAEIDVERAGRAKAEAERRIAETGSDVARAELARALTRLRISG